MGLHHYVLYTTFTVLYVLFTDMIIFTSNIFWNLANGTVLNEEFLHIDFRS